MSELGQISGTIGTLNETNRFKLNKSVISVFPAWQFLRDMPALFA